MKPQHRSNRVTIADVARHVNLSPMTVSRVINQDSKVKKSTREKVEAAIASLNYAPNLAARSLAKGHIQRICLLYGNPSSAYSGELLLGALNAVSEAGVHLIVERTDTRLEASALESRLGRDWDALIVPPPLSDIAGIRRLLAERDFPAVFLSSATDPGRAHEIRIDDKLAAFEATTLLLEKGHKRIGFIKGHPNQTNSARRYQGYCEALSGFGTGLDPDLITEGLFTYRSGEQAAAHLLSLHNRPTAIFASNDDMAAGAMAAAARLDIKIPSELALIGFDDSPIASTVWPPLTTLRQPVADMAAKAVQMLLTFKANKTSAGTFSTTIMPHRLIERDTT